MIRRNNTAAAPAKKTFGQAVLGHHAQAEEKIRSDVYLNIGYETGDADYPFVSLPFGIGLDTMQQAQPPRRGDTDYAAFVAAKNALLADLQKMAESLAPGEEVILSMPGSEGGLVIQMRRRESETEAPAVVSDRFAPKFSLAMPEAA